jgi:transcriptional regulator with XRE-family HTH domain
MLVLAMEKERKEIEGIYRKVAKRVSEKLKREDKSAEKLAFEIGLSKTQMYLFINGKRRMTLHTLERIAEGLEIPLKDLIP